MIPILYDKDETRFVTNGIGRLSDCTRAVVTEERNGIYELEFDYPITGAHFDEIIRGRIVACTHDDKHDIQPFVIYRRSVPDLNGIVTFNAHHISYKLNDVVVTPYTAESVVGALQGISDNSVNANPFTFWTDKTTTGTYTNDVPRNARNMLGGEENSILDVYGAGDYEFDKFDVKLYQHRGVDTDVEIRYSKNLVGLSEDVDDSESYNAVVPYWTDGETTVLLPERILVFSGTESQTAYLTDHNLVILRTESNEPLEASYLIIDAAPMDLSDAFEEEPTTAQLRTAATARFENSDAWLPNENLSVDFVQMWQTEEYKDYSALQRVSLCDTVSVYYPQVGISKVKQKVIKVEYNVLLDRYDSIELGTPQTSLGQAIQAKIMEDVPTTSMMQSAIEYATDLIRGGLGGYVVMTPGETGYPQEILIMDTPDVNTAVNVWRFNQGGLGHSSNGYNGPFSDIALTQDGKINASMITTGALNANLITAGMIKDSTGRNYWDLDAGQFVTTRGQIGGLTIDASELYYQSSVRRASIDNSAISFMSNITNGTREGARIDHKGIGWLYLDDQTSWELSELWDMWLSTAGNLIISTNSGGRADVVIFEPGQADFIQKVHCSSGLEVVGTKSRVVKTDNYSERLLYAYETPTPLFGDIGEAVIDSDGLAYVDIDDIFSETIAGKVEYQVFLQTEGEGTCYVAEKHPRYFVVKGTPNLKVTWELKAKQRNYELTRLEQSENGLEEYENVTDGLSSLDSYINEQEELLYG